MIHESKIQMQNATNKNSVRRAEAAEDARMYAQHAMKLPIQSIKLFRHNVC